MNEHPGRSSFDIAVICRDPAWSQVAPRAAGLARRAATAALARAAGQEPRDTPLEAAVVLADDALVQDLNDTYRGQDRPTNVLSFPNAADAEAVGRPRVLGDVILARETVLREAAEQSKSLADHLAHLVVHGVLHLLGYDHATRLQARKMEALEVAILADLGIADPYRCIEQARDSAT